MTRSNPVADAKVLKILLGDVHDVDTKYDVFGNFIGNVRVCRNYY